MFDPRSLSPQARDQYETRFYRALGQATARWQHVESGLFIIVHAIFGTDHRYSSAVFFQIKSGDTKLQLTDELCRVHFSEAIYKGEWDDLQKRLKDAIIYRNRMAHWEVNWVTDRSQLAPGEPPIALSPHHLDHRSERKAKGPNAASTNTLQEAAQAYLMLARDLLLFVRRHFELEKLRATHLPPMLLQFLERFHPQNTPEHPPEPPQPPRSGPGSAQPGNRRARRKAERDRRRK
jgi:hypothetical protein